MSDINLSDKILGDAKRFIAILLFIAMRFYIASLRYEDVLRSLLQEKLMHFMTK